MRDNHAPLAYCQKAMPLTLTSSVFGVLLAFACVAASAAQEPQLPADQRAFQAAMAQADPAKRLTALRAFSVEYGDSKYFDGVQEAALKLLLQYFPQRTAEIRDQVGVNVANAEKGYDRLLEQAREADQLAGAGVLLPLAQHLALEAAHGVTEAVYLRGMARMFGELQSEMPTPEELHGGYTEARAVVVLSLAHVYLRQGKPQLTEPLLQEAATLQPRSPQLYALRGEAALAAKQDAAALAAFESAAVLGELSPTDREAMQQLFQAAHPQAPEDALEAELDGRWTLLNPLSLELGSRSGLHPGGHTPLLELFTGVGCLPCAGADLAAEALAASYGPKDLVLLEWDEHSPLPDPLANPASVARAEVLGAGNTPTFFLDGKRMAVFGGTVAEARAIAAALHRIVAVQAARAGAFSLQLSATRDGDSRVQALAHVTSRAADLLQAAAVEEDAPWPGDSLTVAAQAHEQADLPVSPVLTLALVEHRVRYSGENGIRFHSMVVRATSSPPAFGNALHPGQQETLHATFDPAAIQQDLRQYLRAFEQSNTRFGPVHFASTDVVLKPAELGVVAFVQDTRTHRVLQAAYAPVPPALEVSR